MEYISEYVSEYTSKYISEYMREQKQQPKQQPLTFWWQNNGNLEFRSQCHIFAFELHKVVGGGGG